MQPSGEDFPADFLEIFVEMLDGFFPAHIIQTVAVGGGGTEPLACRTHDRTLSLLDHLTTDAVVEIPEEGVCTLVVADPEEQIPSGAVVVAVVGVVFHACTIPYIDHFATPLESVIGIFPKFFEVDEVPIIWQRSPGNDSRRRSPYYDDDDYHAPGSVDAVVVEGSVL